MEKSAVNSYFTEFVFDQNELFSLVAFVNKLFDKSGLSYTRSAKDHCDLAFRELVCQLVYDGVFTMLSALRDAGYTMMMATGTPHEYARRIAAHFGLDAYLTSVYGAEFDGTRGDKAELLRYAMEREGLSPSECVMIGDRRYDIEGALRVGATPIGVLWGYGDRAELCTAGCEHFAMAPADLVEIVKSL